MKIITSTKAHSVFMGVQIFKETHEDGAVYFSFLDKSGHKHVRNTAKKGGTLKALRRDIDYYRFMGWV